MENMDKGLSTKMGADKSTESTPYASNLICPSPKVWYCDEKRLHRASVVRGQQVPALHGFWLGQIQLLESTRIV